MKKTVKTVLVLFLSLVSPAVGLASPVGVWLSENYVESSLADYSSMFKSWLVVEKDTVDHVISLGAHYYKAKYHIRRHEDGRLVLEEMLERTAHVLNFKQAPEGLQFCFDKFECSSYRPVEAVPDFYLPQKRLPDLRLEIRWCVEGSCEAVRHSAYETERLMNLSEDFRAYSHRFLSPEVFNQAAGFSLALESFSYRLHNNVDNADAFSSMFALNVTAEGKGDMELLRSPVITLKDGAQPFAVFEATHRERQVKIELYLVGLSSI